MMKNNKKALMYLQRFFASIEQYTNGQIFDIKDSFKNLIKPIARTKVDLAADIKEIILQEITKFLAGFEATPLKPDDPIIIHQAFAPDSALELIEHLERLHMNQRTCTCAENLLMKLPPDAKEIDAVRSESQ